MCLNVSELYSLQVVGKKVEIILSNSFFDEGWDNRAAGGFYFLNVVEK